jgi:hypothetical protein
MQASGPSSSPSERAPDRFYARVVGFASVRNRHRSSLSLSSFLARVFYGEDRFQSPGLALTFDAGKIFGGRTSRFKLLLGKISYVVGELSVSVKAFEALLVSGSSSVLEFCRTTGLVMTCAG